MIISNITGTSFKPVTYSRLQISFTSVHQIESLFDMAEYVEGWEDSIIEATSDKYFQWLENLLNYVEKITGVNKKMAIRGEF